MTLCRGGIKSTLFYSVYLGYLLNVQIKGVAMDCGLERGQAGTGPGQQQELVTDPRPGQEQRQGQVQRHTALRVQKFGRNKTPCFPPQISKGWVHLG